MNIEDIRARYTSNRIKANYNNEVRFLLERLDEARKERDRLRDERDLQAKYCSDAMDERDEATERQDRWASLAYELQGAVLWMTGCGAFDRGSEAGDAFERDVRPLLDDREPEVSVAHIRAEAEAAALERAGVADLWPVVIRFAQLMQRKLNENRHKGDREAWLGDDPASLVRRVNEEAHELGQAVLRLIIEDFDGRDGLRPHVAAEAADVANMAMMVWDSCAREDIPDASAPIRALANGKDGEE